MSSRYFEYQLTGKPVSYINDVAHDIDVVGSDIDWHDKAVRLQARRWKKILRSS